MAARRRSRRSCAPPVEARIETLSHDGRGIARLEGKTVFVDGALPGERVLLRYRSQRRSFDEGEVVEVMESSPLRRSPKCPHFGTCGGCRLQHLDGGAQIEAKQRVLLDNLRRLGGVAPDAVLPPLTGPAWGYRRKARLGVKYVRKKGRVLVGFRERHSALVADLQRCEVLHPSVGERIADLAALIASLEARERIAQIEVAVSDDTTALVLRNLDPLSDTDRARVAAFGRAQRLQMWLQPAGPDSAQPLEADAPPLTYRLPEADVTLEFTPTDFTQINAAVNNAMVTSALTLLEPQGRRVLDLFCGLGNFTLPLARQARAVVGVEGDSGLIARAVGNAARNGIGNVRFHTCDLAGPLDQEPWIGEGFDRVLLDPPRSGALEVLPALGRLGAERVVYVSCHPATLARDVGLLVQQHGYRLQAAGVMDMFPHTAHVESIALLVR